MAESVQTAAPVQSRAIDRRHRLPYAEFERQYLRGNQAVIVSGCMDDWPALAKWSPAFFREEYGSTVVTAAGRPQRMAELIDQVLASTAEHPAPYLKDAVVRNLGPELVRDIEPFAEYCFPNWLQGRYPFRSIHDLLNAAQVELFLGGAGTALGEMHYDYVHTHTVLCQVYGRKEFTLFAPADTPWLYASGNQSAIKNVDAVDHGRYPLFARATPIHFIQEPGEIVFLPSGWWHTTRLLTASIAVGVNFANATNWAAVTRDVCNEVGLRRPLRRALIHAYLTGLGLVKRLHGRWAGARELGITPARGGPV